MDITFGEIFLNLCRQFFNDDKHYQKVGHFLSYILLYKRF